MSIYLGNQLVAGNSDNGVPTGTILPYGGSTAPNGFLLCDGSAVSRTTYAALYAVIGDAYGAGDGNSTFNLPNLDFLLKGIKGNGMTLGLTDSINNGGLTHWHDANGHALGAMPNTYGKLIGTAASGTELVPYVSYGITTDPTKSGIETNISSSIKYVIKY